jgi:hypothetical protein
MFNTKNPKLDFLLLPIEIEGHIKLVKNAIEKSTNNLQKAQLKEMLDNRRFELIKICN